MRIGAWRRGVGFELLVGRRRRLSSFVDDGFVVCRATGTWYFGWARNSSCLSRVGLR